MGLVPSKFFILSVLLSCLLVNGMIVPSFAVPPIPQTSDIPESLIMQSESSPLKQFKVGIPLPNIFCKPTLVLVFKISEGSPACMKSETAQKLVERGWGVLNEQTVWFEFEEIACVANPWDQWNKNFAETHLPKLIKAYFKEQGITIIESDWTWYANARQPASCGHLVTSYYFLVPQLDINKMESLEYKKVDSIPSIAHWVGKV